MPPHRRQPLRFESLEDRLAPAAAGSFDPSFGFEGIHRFPQDTLPNLVTTGPDGSVVVVAGTTLFANDRTTRGPQVAVRLTPDGEPDPSFGNGGRAELPQFQATAVAVQPDGGVLVVGEKDPVGRNVIVVRLRADGLIDPAFGVGGLADTGVSGDGLTWLEAVAVRPDGRLLFVGGIRPAQLGSSGTPITAKQSFAAIQLTADGKLDSGFGSGGIVAVPFPVGEFNSAAASAVVVQPDGRAVLAGSVVSGSHPGRISNGSPTFVEDRDFAAIRLTEDGRLDSTFGEGGSVRVPFELGGNKSDSASAVGLLSDGRIILAGSAEVGSEQLAYTAAAARLMTDGRLDPAYGDSGRATGGGPDGFTSTATVHADGRTVFTHDISDGSTRLRQLTADGRPDPEFGMLPLSSTIGSGTRPAVQMDGNLVFTGYTTVYRVYGRATPVPISPGSFLAGGSPDGFARPIEPSGETFAATEPMEFFPGFPGTVRTATADVTGDGVPDLVGGAGPGGGPHVRVFDGKNGRLVGEVFAFEESFTGGVYVAAADLTGDGKADLVVTPDQGGGPVVAIYDGAKLTPLPLNSGAAAQLTRYFGIEDANFRGGARPAVGDVTGDSTPDIIVAAGFLGGPRVTIWDGKSVLVGAPVPVANFFAFESTLRNGTFVAAGDVTGDGRADLAFGGGPGGSPRVRLFNGKELLAAAPFDHLDDRPAAERANFFAGDAAQRGGVRLALRDSDANGKADLITGSGEGEPSRVRLYLSETLLSNPVPVPDQELDPFGTVLSSGVFVG